ncbi:bacteriocin immunity protein [Pseudomonas plecoglossicida]|uniref:bacteriocin immunity protein n=1 Tax=Pseudomonas plecoglossicida TaxID=70775 RepID=UPI0015E4801F|nr:bacteriocin immunity protein [Pseudomonas plecoglossicida]MBA1200147.1 bacteriocin immunity protein [Pseudomonas plecoglossicida]
MILKPRLSDYTEADFLEFIHEIDRANEDEPDHILSALVIHFSEITEHPSGYDLLYKPATPELGEPAQVLRLVKEWRSANGKDGFKPS